MAERHERKIQRLRRISKLPWEKTLTALDRSRLPQSVDRQLTALLEGTFLDRAENVLAFGNPGRRQDASRPVRSPPGSAGEAARV